MHLHSLLAITLACAASAAHSAPLASSYVGYLVTYFIGNDERIFQSISNGNDAYSYTALNGGNAVLTPSSGTGGVRDPYLVASPSRDNYWIIGTDLDIDKTNFDAAQRNGSRSILVWNSNDLVNWSADRLVEVETDTTAGMVWAPSAVYDAATSRYYVFWASKFYAQSDTSKSGDAVQPDTIRYASTTDFKTFSAPQDYLRGANGTPLIDQEFQSLGNNAYVRFLKDEAAGKIFAEKSTNGLFGTWTRLSGTNGWAVDANREGPASFADNIVAGKYHLFADDYSGSGRYVPYETTDIDAAAYYAADAPNFPNNLRHGSVLPVTQSEYDALRARV